KATAVVSEPPRPRVVMRLSGPMPWKPATTATIPWRKRSSITAVSMRWMRALPWASSVTIGTCQPCQERAETPTSCSARAVSPQVTCSPDATTASYSRASWKREMSRTQSTSWLVAPAMAETTTATSAPASASRFTRRATARMRSTSPTEVPPNFMTRRGFLGCWAMRVLRGRKSAVRRLPGKRRLSILFRVDRGKAAPGKSADVGAQVMSDSSAPSDSEPADPRSASIDPAETAKFAAMAEAWWDPQGKFRPLHKFNPTRLAFIRDRVAARHGRDPLAPRPLADLRLLDIGCGGGLLAEPMARLRAEATGLDP